MMPSALGHQVSPHILDINPAAFDLLGPSDPASQYGLAADGKETDGAALAPRPALINGSFDESSTLSTHDSDISDTAPMPPNGNGTRPTSMSSLTNGKSLLTADSDARDIPKPQPLPNGAVSLVDRSRPPPSTSVESSLYESAPSSVASPPSHLYGRPAQSSLEMLPTRRPASDACDEGADDGHLALAANHHDDNDGRGSGNNHNDNENDDDYDDGGAISPMTVAVPRQAISNASESRISSSLPHSLPSSGPAPSQPSLHRFSSPAAYHPLAPPPVAPSAASSSVQIQPPAATLAVKQRYALDVPKSSPNRRLSREGNDLAHFSGRFSPSIAGSSDYRRASLNLVRRTTRSMHSEPPRDDIIPDEDAVRWAEAYRHRRASKRKRKDEDEDRVLVGTKVDESHANWVTAYNMLTGIRVSVSRTNAKLDRELTDADFETKQKSTFDITGNELVPSAKYDFKFKDYAPWVFRHLRALFRLDPADYLMSLTGKYILSELGSPGKSGSFFYFSRDYKYIIKTIHHSEHKFMRKILKQYYNHVQENPNTLLSQFYGLHRVKMPYGKKIHFVVMNNLFPPHRDIHATFDLKGSTVGRDYREEELAKNPRATLKDLNWLRRHRHLELGLEKKRLFLQQLQRDVLLLQKLQIMDYSLLVGIHDLTRGNNEHLRDKTLQVFNPGGEKTLGGGAGIAVPAAAVTATTTMAAATATASNGGGGSGGTGGGAGSSSGAGRGSEDAPSVLRQTVSKMESARNARELRQMLRQERPIPMGQALDRMPDELGEGHSRPGFVFNQDDGGFRATHENNSPANEIYYLGVIDCLTHYGMIKKIEHFWKGLSHDKTQISALPPDEYGNRFYNFVEGITLSAEEARRLRGTEDEAVGEGLVVDKSSRQSRESRPSRSRHGIPSMPDHQPPAGPSVLPSPEGRETIEMASKEARRTLLSGTSETDVPDRVLKAAVVVPEGRDLSLHESILPVVEEAGESGHKEGEEDGEEKVVTGGEEASTTAAAREKATRRLEVRETTEASPGDNGAATAGRSSLAKFRFGLSQPSSGINRATSGSLKEGLRREGEAGAKNGASRMAP